MQGKSNKTVLYIIGLGRSGTTLLDIVLGNATGFSSSGELTRYPVEKGEPLNFPEGHQSKIFWTDIKEEMAKRYSNGDYKKFSRLRFVFEYHLFFIFNYLDLFPGNVKSKYLSFVNSLYQNVFEKIDDHVLIDSSKYPGRAITISGLNRKQIEVKYLMIKRHPVPFVRSYLKRDVEQRGKSWFMANLYYFITMLFCNLTLKKLRKKHKVSVISHEDFVLQFDKTTKKIEGDLGIDLEILRKKHNQSEPFKVGNIYYGNRVRLKKEVLLESTLIQLSPTNIMEKLTGFWNQGIYNSVR